MTSSRHMRAFVSLVLLALTLNGCIAVGNSPTVQRPTVGQELIDLKAALEKGAMTQAEYDRQRTELLNRKN